MGLGTRIRMPLSEPAFFILLGLHHGPRHGWGLRRWVREVTCGRVQLRGGALFDNLQRLLEGGYLLRVEEPQVGRTRRRRHFYALTESGRDLARAEIGRVAELTAVIQMVNAGDPPKDVQVA